MDNDKIIQLKKQRDEINKQIEAAYENKEIEDKNNFKNVYPILKPYIEEEYFHEDSYYIKFVPLEVMKKLIEMKLMDAEATAGISNITMQKLIELAEKYKGVCGGRAIPGDISFDQIIFDVSKEEAKKLKRRLKPDDFRKEERGYCMRWD